MKLTDLQGRIIKLVICGDRHKNWNLFIKTYVFLHIETSVTFKVLSIWCNTPIEMFFPLLKSFWTHQCLLVLLLFFRFSSPTLAKHFPLRKFSSRETKNVTQGEIRWIGGWAMGVMQFLVKNCWALSAVWAGALENHPSWNGQTHWKEASKKFAEAKHNLSQPCQEIHWYRWVPKTLT